MLTLSEAIKKYKAVVKERTDSEDYNKEVNKLIPKAILMANNMMAGKKRYVWKQSVGGVGMYKHCLWSEEFHAAMSRLTKSRGLRR